MWRSDCCSLSQILRTHVISIEDLNDDHSVLAPYEAEEDKFTLLAYPS